MEKLHINFRDMSPSASLEAHVRARFKALSRVAGQIISCKVTIERRHRHQRHGGIYSVSIDLTMPGAEVVISRDNHLDRTHEDAYVAVRDAFDAARRRLEDTTRKMRIAVKTHTFPANGKVQQLFPYLDYGVILTPEGREVYFHRNACLDGFEQLAIGDELRFELHEPLDEAGPHASGVKRTSRKKEGKALRFTG